MLYSICYRFYQLYSSSFLLKNIEWSEFLFNNTESTKSIKNFLVFKNEKNKS